MIKYIVKNTVLSDSGAFTEASKEELRVLLLLITLDAEDSNVEKLAKLCKISTARAKSALAFWEGAGIISSAERSQTITEEFEEKLSKIKIRETSAKETAKSIRNAALKDMIDECAGIMGRTALSTTEIKELTALHEQYALSEEYIVALAAHLNSSGKLTVTKLVNRAIKLTENEIDTPQALEEYIIERENRSVAEGELRKLFGIYDRALSKTEKECFRKWSADFGYFTDIIGEAYDIAVTMVSRGHIKYVDKLLSSWHEAGCKTLAECRDKYEGDKLLKKEIKEYPKGQKTSKKAKESYGNFDIDDAFIKAIERSYGDN